MFLPSVALSLLASLLGTAALAPITVSKVYCLGENRTYFAYVVVWVSVSEDAVTCESLLSPRQTDLVVLKYCQKTSLSHTLAQD
jgi:hypothetical protein